MKRKIHIFVVIALGLIVSQPLAAADSAPMQNGRQAPAHYLENCVDCHRQMVSGNPELLYSRASSIADDVQSLRQRVIYCQSGLGLDWSRGEISQVVDYLNRNFYHYK